MRLCKRPDSYKATPNFLLKCLELELPTPFILYLIQENKKLSKQERISVMKRSIKAALIAKAAMWVMIAAIVGSFFVKSRWITITWIAAASLCLICTLLVALNKNR
jgi:hypothetical protein